MLSKTVKTQFDRPFSTNLNRKSLTLNLALSLHMAIPPKCEQQSKPSCPTGNDKITNFFFAANENRDNIFSSK